MLKLDPAVLKLTAAQQRKRQKQRRRKLTTTANKVFFFGRRKKKGWALVRAMLPQIVEYGRRQGIIVQVAKII